MLLVGFAVVDVGVSLVDVVSVTHLAGTAGSAYPQLTPSEDAVAYYIAGDIWLMKLGSGERAAVVVSPRWESRFSISPYDGVMAFTSERGPAGRTVVCLAEIGRGERGCLPPLAEFTYVCGPQSWLSPDSLLICGMESERGWWGGNEIISSLAGTGVRWHAWIWEVSISGEKIRTIHEGEGLFYSAWGPGGRILYTSDTDKPPIIWLLDTTTGEQKPLIKNGLFPSWSPDGRLIAFVRDGDLWVASPDGRDEQQITTGLGRVVTPSWSPDGGKIFFARFPPLDEDRGSAGLYYVELATRRELPSMMVVSTIILSAILISLLLRFRPTNLKVSER